MDKKVSFSERGAKETRVPDWSLRKSIVLGGSLLMVSVLAALVLKISNPEKVVPVPPSELFKTPEHYVQGEIPSTELEKRAYAEYLRDVKAVGKKGLFGETLHRAENEVALAIARKYRMPPKSIAYLVLKLGYREVPPGDYVLPSEPD